MMGTYLGVALGEKAALGGLFEAIIEDKNERKGTLWCGEVEGQSQQAEVGRRG